jgi:phage/plasmid-associated DNA primase
MALDGKRAAFVTELEAATMHTEFFKKLAGSDEVTGRAMYANEVKTFLPRSKIIIATNQPPIIEDKTDGFWRKVVINDQFSSKIRPTTTSKK